MFSPQQGNVNDIRNRNWVNMRGDSATIAQHLPFSIVFLSPLSVKWNIVFYCCLRSNQGCDVSGWRRFQSGTVSRVQVRSEPPRAATAHLSCCPHLSNRSLQLSFFTWVFVAHHSFHCNLGRFGCDNCMKRCILVWMSTVWTRLFSVVMK